MISRLVIVLFTIAFIAYSWINAGKAHSKEHAVNDFNGQCNCHAT